ncbi:hypothetical protein SBD_5051 [Streptomyces bottropensis ATCC 25435]|uniref:Uncharacterized protein n=1 Tax=Streptomyces bottropensis ATCC 25435 TaxID=1054862 RepID=M3DAZ3_9ACTN|nr:hypothetical protein SBD_5051 [Streptomyces bottropensis ATCC 25435]
MEPPRTYVPPAQCGTLRDAPEAASVGSSPPTAYESAHSRPGNGAEQGRHVRQLGKDLPIRLYRHPLPEYPP